MRLASVSSLIACLVVLACSDGEQLSSSMQPTQAQADSAATFILQGLARSTPICRTEGSPPAQGRAVRVTARLCLSCKSIGYLLRTLAGERKAPVFIVMPDDHTDSVCEFLKQERARVPIFTVKEDPRIPSLLSNSILVVEFDSAGNHSSVAAKDALRLLERLGR